jgi:hypothetical protein
MPFLLVCGQSVTTGAVGEVGEVGGFLIVTVFSPYYSSLLTCNQNQISKKQTMTGSPTSPIPPILFLWQVSCAFAASERYLIARVAVPRAVKRGGIMPP